MGKKVKVEVPGREKIEGLSRKDAEKHLAELREEVRRHDHLYYVLDSPEISDDEYDRLYDALRRIEERFPDLVTTDSPTQRVGAEPREEFPVVAHAARMLSLDATREEKDVRRFDERVRKAVGEKVRYLLEEKFDGASIELVYEDGNLVRGVTRGNGREGEQVTENVKTIRSVPLRLQTRHRKAPSFLSIRGEVLMRIGAFERLNRRLMERGSAAFANPRNAAAGSLRQLDPRITAERPLELIAYDILAVEGESFATDGEVLEALRDWGMKTPQKVTTANDIDEAIEDRQRWVEQRDTLDYEIDGLVIKVDRLDAREKMGETAHHPRWALAYKFEPRREVTRVEDIGVQVGRTGVLTPVALMRPVDVGGVTVSRASLHNREEVRRKDVRVGDRVRIQRAGDVIPEVVERIPEPGRPREKAFEMPSRCPSCDTAVIEDGPRTVCPNRFGCPAQLKGRVEHFGSEPGLDIEGLGSETVAALVDRGFVESLADLFRLEPEDVIQLDGFAEKSANKLVNAIRARRQIELHRLLYGLAIPEVGAKVSRDLAEHFHTLEAVRKADRETLIEVSGIGPKMAEAIHGFFAEPRNQQAIDELLEVGVEAKTARPPEKQPLGGMRLVFTGTLERFSRKEAEKLAQSLGARVTSSVSGETDYVVAGEGPGQKIDDAREKDVKVLDEDGFVKLVRDAGADV